MEGFDAILEEDDEREHMTSLDSGFWFIRADRCVF
jgi:hypothetical protein